MFSRLRRQKKTEGLDFADSGVAGAEEVEEVKGEAEEAGTLGFNFMSVFIEICLFFFFFLLFILLKIFSMVCFLIPPFTLLFSIHIIERPMLHKISQIIIKYYILY